MNVDLTPVHTALAAWPRANDESYRLFHGRGGCYPGLEQLTLDYFEGLLIATLYKDPGEAMRDALAQLLSSQVPEIPKVAVCIQHRYADMAPVQWLQGEMESGWAVRGPLKFGIQTGSAQNLGYFLDMEPGRQWLEQRVAGKRVLNLFAYTCAFSVVAIAAGAASVVNVDMSSAALARGRDNHRANGQPLENVKFLAENILKSWGRIKRAGPYDVIIVDPPSFQRGSFVATKDYGKVLRRLPGLFDAGGEILACLNAPELDNEFLLEKFREHCPSAQWRGRLAMSPDFPDADPERALKLHHFSVDAHHSTTEA